MQSNVTKLPSKPQAQAATKPRNRATKALTRQTVSAAALGGVAVTLTALSLSHLANGVEIVTGSAPWASWATAVGIDLGFIWMELCDLTATSDKLRKQIRRFTKPAIAGTLVWSAIMNAFAFASHTDWYVMTAAAIVLGASIPALIYCLTRIGAALYIDCHTKA